MKNTKNCLLYYIRALMLCLLITLQSGCASLDKSMLLGGFIGATVGGALGHQIPNGDNNQNVTAGVIIGGLLGTAIGNSEYKNRVAKESAPPVNLINKKDDVPSLTMPKVRRVWAPDRIEGDKYISGHYIYVIEKSSSWSNAGEEDGK